MANPPKKSRVATRESVAMSLLRALAALGPRLHEPLAEHGPASLYQLVCDTLRECGLYGHISRLDEAGALRIAATSIPDNGQDTIAAMIGTSVLGYAIPHAWPYDAVLDRGETLIADDEPTILVPILPQIDVETRAQIAQTAGLERLVVAPLIARGQVLGALSVWGPRSQLEAADTLAVSALAAQIGTAIENTHLFHEAQAEHARWRATVDDMAELVVLCDPQGYLTHFNTSANWLLGQLDATLSLEEQPAAYGLHAPDGRQLAADELPLARVLATRRPVLEAEIWLRRPNMPDRWTVWSASPVLGVDAETLGAVAVGRDITEQRVLEQQNRSAIAVLLRVANLATAPSRPDDPAILLTRVVEVLRELTAVAYAHASLVDERTGRLAPLALYGASLEEEALWRDEVLAFDPEAPEIAEQVRQARTLLEAGHVLPQRFEGDETGIIAPKTLRRLGVRAALSAPVLANGHVIGLLTISRVHPVSGTAQYFASWDEELLAGVGRLIGEAIERARLTAELTTSEAERLAAEEANRQMDEFLNIASHELRTPVTSAKMALEVTTRRLRQFETAPDSLSESATETVLHMIQRMVASSTRSLARLERLVEDLLDASRTHGERLGIEPARFDLVALVREVVDEQRAAWPDRDLGVDAPSGALIVEADPDRIAQVIHNYLSNALKYAPHDHPITAHVETPAGWARVAVHDRGPGLTDEQRARVWERFYQVQGMVQQGSEIGLGLGLYISRHIVELHSGKVGVESRAGEGATFWFTLPLAPKSASAT
jgi:PAS domain S-box-containing protein